LEDNGDSHHVLYMTRIFYCYGSLHEELIGTAAALISEQCIARRYAPRRWQFDAKIVADLRPSADKSAVRASLVAGGG